MAKEPPGLEYKPDDERLVRFGSLMPEEEKRPGVARRVLGAPLAILKLPLRALAAVLRLPGKLLRRSDHSAD